MSSGVVVWFTGLPASGKSTLAARVRDRMAADETCVVLDGDAVRAALVPAPGYSEQQRRDFYRTLANLACLIAHQGTAVLVPATAHLRAFRAHARERAPRFIEVHVAAPLEQCKTRDVKQLYVQASEREHDQLPGHGVTYEAPIEPDIIATGGCDEVAAERVVEAIRAARQGDPLVARFTT